MRAVYVNEVLPNRLKNAESEELLASEELRQLSFGVSFSLRRKAPIEERQWLLCGPTTRHKPQRATNSKPQAANQHPFSSTFRWLAVCFLLHEL